MNKTILTIAGVIIVIGAIFLFSGDKNNGTEITYTGVTSTELNEMLQDKDFTLVDVHTPEQVHIPGTDLFIPYDDLDALVAALPDKDAKIVLYCRSGGMSKIAAKSLIERGYTNLFDLTNGMNEWSSEGRETIPKGSVPIRASSSDGNAGAYIALGPSNSIGVFDTDANKIIDTLPAGNNPHGIAIVGNRIFTTSTKMGKNEMMMEPDHDDGKPVDMKKMMSLGSNIISVTDINKKEVIKEIDIGGGTHHMASTQNGTTILATVPSQSGVVLINAKTLEKSAFIETGIVPNYVAVSPDSSRAYISNKGDDTVSIIDLETKILITNVSVGVRPDHLAVSDDGQFVYVTNAGSDDISVINSKTQKVVATISTGEIPHGVGILPDGSKVYVSNSESKTVSVIDTKTNTVIKNIQMDSEVEHLEVSPDGNKVFVNSEGSKVIYSISTDDDSVIEKLKIGKQPHQMVFK